MRLIDADKLELNCIYTSTLEKADTVYQYSYSERQIEKAPTVEAIPVEWIKQWDAKCQNGELSYWLCDDYEWHEAIVAMLADWKEENETD